MYVKKAESFRAVVSDLADPNLYRKPYRNVSLHARVERPSADGPAETIQARDDLKQSPTDLRSPEVYKLPVLIKLLHFNLSIWSLQEPVSVLYGRNHFRTQPRQLQRQCAECKSHRGRPLSENASETGQVPSRESTANSENKADAQNTANPKTSRVQNSSLLLLLTVAAELWPAVCQLSI